MSATAMRVLLPVLSITLSGCAPAIVPVVKQSLKCELPADMLQPCTQPDRIRDGVTYKDIIEIMVQDRDNLRRCAQRQESLAGAAALCQAEVAKYNKDVEETNARNAGKK
jgi:hypothetical protein